LLTGANFKIEEADRAVPKASFSGRLVRSLFSLGVHADLAVSSIVRRTLICVFFFYTFGAQAVTIHVVRPVEAEELSMPIGFTFVVGTVSPPDSVVTCNGTLCDVDEDGAFLGFVPIRLNQGWLERKGQLCDAEFTFVARHEDEMAREVIDVFTPRSPSAAKLAQAVFEPEKTARVLRDQWVGLEGDNLGDVALIPKDARVQVASGSASNYTCRLPQGEEITISASELETDEGAGVAELTPKVFHIPDQTEISPFWKASAECPRAWGFWAFSEGEHLDVKVKCSLRQAEGPVDESRPLNDFKICLDPGHHPDPGAIGPRGFEERHSTLLIAHETAELLRAEGAEVEFTREEDPLPLKERHARIHHMNPDIMVSIHNNSVGDGDDPRLRRGTQTFYLYPWSKPLAEEVHHAILEELGTQDRGCIQRNLYMTRYPGCPSILIEPEYLIIPDQEKKFMNPEYRHRLATAIVKGIRNFVLRTTSNAS